MILCSNKVLCALVLRDRKAGNARTGRRKRIKARAVVDHVAEAHGVVPTEVVVKTDSALVEIVMFGDSRSEDIQPRVGHREEIEKTAREGTDERRRQLVEGKRSRWIGKEQSELMIWIAAEAGSVKALTLRRIA